MSERNLNRLLFETIDKIREIESPKVSMWAINDKYAYPPYFRFRFRDTQEEDIIYKMLSEIVLQFKGSLQWEMIHDGNRSANYIILPKSFSPFVFEKNFRFEKKSFLNYYPLSDYENTIDKAIMDIPNLAAYITEQYQAKRGVSR